MTSSDEIQACIREAWPRIAPRADASRPPVMWQTATSLAFPEVWPPAKPGQPLAVYAFATAFDPGLADGVRVAAPWAVIHVAPHQAAIMSFEWLTQALQPIGIQGVHPIDPRTRQGEASGQRAATALRQMARTGTIDEAQAAAVRSFYRHWLQENGVIAGSLAARHKSFFQWLLPRSLEPGRRSFKRPWLQPPAWAR